MTIGSQNATLAVARDLMDKTLAAPSQALELRFYDDDEGGAVNGKRHTRAWALRIYQARSAMRKAQARIARPEDLISSGLTRDAVDPEAVRTAYDTLYTEAFREEAPRPCWVLRIAKANSSGLNLTLL